MGKRLTKEEVVRRAREVHGDKYDYSEFLKNEFIFKGVEQKIPIICHAKDKHGKEHGIILQRALSHMNGKGCYKCNKGVRLPLDEILERCKETHGDRYDYSLVTECKSINETKIPIICHKKYPNGEEHGVFYCTIKNHVNHKRGCPKCNGGSKYTVEDFKRVLKMKKNSELLSFDENNYINYETPMEFVCFKHGKFVLSPHSLIESKGCPYCFSSRLETNVKYSLDLRGINYEHNKTFDWLVNDDGNKLKCDFYLEKYNLVIECHGRQHFEAVDVFGGEEEFKKRIRNDEIKLDLCRKHGIDILYYAEKNTYDYPYKIYTSRKKILTEILKRNRNE